MARRFTEREYQASDTRMLVTDALLSIRLASLVFAAGARTSGAIRNPLVVPAFAHAVTLRHARSPR